MTIHLSTDNNAESSLLVSTSGGWSPPNNGGERGAGMVTWVAIAFSGFVLVAGVFVAVRRIKKRSQGSKNVLRKSINTSTNALISKKDAYTSSMAAMTWTQDNGTLFTTDNGLSVPLYLNYILQKDFAIGQPIAAGGWSRLYEATTFSSELAERSRGSRL
jgi:hypothetical protein